LHVPGILRSKFIIGALLKEDKDLNLCLSWRLTYIRHLSDRFDNWDLNDGEFVQQPRHLNMEIASNYQHFFLIPDRIHIVHHRLEKVDIDLKY
jgi:hypothetical protein